MSDSVRPEWIGRPCGASGEIGARVSAFWMNTIGNVSTLWQNGIHFAGFTLLCALVVPAATGAWAKRPSWRALAYRR